jgi:GAF domain-containing protein
MKRAADQIRERGGYRWVGIYEVGSEEISIVAWSGEGPPAFPKFPKGRGLCGAAAASGQTVLVGDVTKDPRYLTTFGSTRSEVIVPIKLATGEVVGLIDVESERVDAFTPRDVRVLEARAEAIARSRD